jgi:ethanolamine ammonia-lyase small subunit
LALPTAWAPFAPGSPTTEANRNGISKIGPEGIDYAAAIGKTARMLNATRGRRTLGIAV